MEDIIILEYLRNKGTISNDEFNDLTTKHTEHSSKPKMVFLSEDDHKILNKSKCITEEQAFTIVNKMWHTSNGNKEIGEYFSMEIAKDLHNRHSHKINKEVSHIDMYIAINEHYHNYSELFKTWFHSNVDYKIVESALAWWFMDEDCVIDSKINKIFIK